MSVKGVRGHINPLSAEFVGHIDIYLRHIKFSSTGMAGCRNSLFSKTAASPFFESKYCYSCAWRRQSIHSHTGDLAGITRLHKISSSLQRFQIKSYAYIFLSKNYSYQYDCRIFFYFLFYFKYIYTGWTIQSDCSSMVPCYRIKYTYKNDIHIYIHT